MTDIKIPRAFADLLKPKRYKIFYGGRGGAKSHNMARALLVLAASKPLRVLATRELQNSIGDSVHKLLSDLIIQYDLQSFYDIQKATIRGINGSEFIFKGLKYNASEIKSTEGIDVCWVEEAENTSDASWEMLLPTIRKDKSEIWVSFNPKNATDPTYQRFVINADETMLVRKVSWRDNPFFPEVLELERQRLLKSDPDAYAHVWEGEPDSRRSGSIYAALIDRARAEGRIAPVAHAANIPVITAWDLGRKHGLSIWFAQIVAREIRVIDYHEAFGNDTDIDIVAQVVKSKPYMYDMHYLPHDGKHERMGMKGSISDQLRKAGLPNRILPQVGIAGGIEKGKALIKSAWIDRDKTKNGLHAMMHYRYEYDEGRQCFRDNPHDDWACDASDAWRYLAIALDQKPLPDKQYTSVTRPITWSPI